MFVGLFLGICTLVGCEKNSMPEGVPKLIVASAQRDFNAILFRVEAGALGATVSDQYEVWLVEALNSDSHKRILLADKVQNISMHWEEENVLNICYVNAQVHEFSNYMVSASEKGRKLKEVRVDLHRDQQCDATSTPLGLR